MNNDIPMLAETRQVLNARSHWQYYGQERPAFAETPEAGQLSVWDFPRPPAIQDVEGLLEVYAESQLIARTERGVRVLETAGAPTYYFPPDDVLVECQVGSGGSICEWKGRAQPLTIAGIENAGWRYVEMFPAFRTLYLWVAFYPNRLDCRVNGESVQPQPGGYYGGWVTSDLAGPIKGEPGSGAW